MKRWLLVVALLSCKTEPAPESPPAVESVTPAEVAFWKWFASHLADPSVPVEIRRRLNDVDPAISYLLNGRMLFLDGGTAKHLAAAAPRIPGWEIRTK